jgi:translation elongation factor EF-G
LLNVALVVLLAAMLSESFVYQGLLLRQSKWLQLAFSSEPYVSELAKLFGNDSVEFYKATFVLQTCTEEAMKLVAVETDKVAEQKDKVAEQKDKVAELNMAVLVATRDLFDATTENLRLKGMLDVRGILEEIERVISPGKMTDPNVSRSSLWASALKSSTHEQLKDALIACFPEQGAKETAVVNTIKSIYKKASVLIHSHIDSNNVAVVVRHRDFPGDDELCVIRALANHFKFKLAEETVVGADIA